jgi:alkanesulfonate monooxygenase SsuD/methylene tetrahydromethanopterin reductase-like flavin-dependent oxidoreductase (luciferase family)
MWTQDRFSFDGLSCHVPERNVLPKPLQYPHPPIWVTVTTPGTELDAADRGIGCLGVAAVTFAEQERRTAEYHRRIELCDPVGSIVTNAVTTQNFLYCHEDMDVAADRGVRMAAAFGLLNAHLLWTREAYPTSAYQSLGNQATRATKETGAPGERRQVPEGTAIGDPAHIIEAIRQWESVGVDGINFILNTTEVIDQEDVLASLRLFAAEVMPKFRRP